jgi:hypothetical protein
MRISVFYCLSISFLFFFQCNISENESLDSVFLNINDMPNAKLIKNTFIDSIFVNHEANKNDICTKSTNDTFICNQNLSYSQAIVILRNKFIQFDSNYQNENTKKYLKALYLCEFVHATFSFQFLGPKLGKTNHNIDIENWNQMTLENCYNMGNNNLAPVWCGDRTSFYVRLLDSLLGIKATSVSIKNVHTFPLVNIGNRRFIVDPYDPFIILDSLKLKIIDYDESLKYCLKGQRLQVIRTKKIFGFPNELVSNDLTKEILAVSKNENQDFSQKIMLYFTKNKVNFLKRINTCSFENYNKKGLVYNSNLKYDRFIIHFINNLNSLPMKMNHFKKFYFGIDCK